MNGNRGLISGRSGSTIVGMMTRARLMTGSLGGVLLLVASPAAAQHRGPGLFAGTFSVTSNTTVSVTSPITTTESRVTHERAEVRAGSRGDLAIHVTNERGERCVLEGNLSSETSVTLLNGQRCTMTDPVRNLRMNLSLRSGSGSISGAHLSLRLSWGVTTSAGFIDVLGTASQETSGTRTGGGPVIAAPVAPTPSPAPVIATPTPMIATPTPAVSIDPVPTTTRGRRGRRGSSNATEGVVMTGAIPVTPTPAPTTTIPQNDAPIWGLPTDLATGAPVPVSSTPVAPTMAPVAPVAPVPAVAPVAPAPAPVMQPTAPAANTPAPLWGAATPSPGLGAPTTASAPAFGTAPSSGLGAPTTAGAPGFGAAPAASAPMFGTTQPMPTAPAAAGSWGGLGAPQAPQPTPGAAPLVSFGGQPGSPQSATAPAFGAPQPAPYGAMQPAPYGAVQPSPYGAMQPTPYGAPQPTPYGYPQPAATPYGYPQQPAPGAAPLVQFGGQRGATPSGWAPGAPAQPGMQPAPTQTTPRPLVMFSVTNGSF